MEEIVEGRDVEIIEVEMTKSDIEEMMGKLNELLNSKDNAEIEISDDTELKINFVEDSEEVEEE